MASNLLAMASNLISMASNLLAMASNLMASNLLAMASNQWPPTCHCSRWHPTYSDDGVMASNL